MAEPKFNRAHWCAGGCVQHCKQGQGLESLPLSFNWNPFFSVSFVSVSLFPLSFFLFCFILWLIYSRFSVFFLSSFSFFSFFVHCWSFKIYKNGNTHLRQTLLSVGVFSNAFTILLLNSYSDFSLLYRVKVFFVQYQNSYSDFYSSSCCHGKTLYHQTKRQECLLKSWIRLYLFGFGTGNVSKLIHASEYVYSQPQLIWKTETCCHCRDLHVNRKCRDSW